MDIKEILSDLSQAYGVSGSEGNAAEVALNILRNYTANCYIDKSGNVIGEFGERRADCPYLMIDSHIDQVGLIVTSITEKGFIRFGNVGGIDRRLLPAQSVIIHGRKKLRGAVCSVPPHLSGGDRDKVLKIEDMAIDAGLDYEKAKSLISPGDAISFDTRFRELLNNEVTGCALDDRCGAASVFYALELLKDIETPGFTVVFSVQEELGERGAKTAAFNVEPDIALAVDVSFAYTQGDCEYKCGKLGMGPMIGISPSLSRALSDKLIDICKDKEIPYQTEVMNGLTSTNADQFSVNKNGCMAGTVSIPLKYMHTPSEIIKIDDLEYTGRLLAEFIKGGILNAE